MSIITPASRTRVAYVAEATASAFGTTPATPTFLEIRRTGGNLTTKKGTAVSDEIHLDRNVRSEYQLSQDPEGPYDFELTYGTYDDILAAALFGTWSANSMWNGGANPTEQSFTFEETLDTGGGTNAYRRFVGCEVESLALNFNARKGVTGSVNIWGQTETNGTSIISGATYTAPNTNIVEVANSVASLAILGLSPVPIVKSMTINIANNLRRREGLGSLYEATNPGAGQIDVTGTMDIYFSSNTLNASILAHATGALSFTVGAVTAKKYTINMPVIQLLSGAVQIGGKNDDVMYRVPFRAIYDGTNGSIQLTRAVA